MRAAILHELGVPEAGEFDEPVAGAGQAVVEVAVAGLNPVDVAIANGSFYGADPPLPTVCGREGVGTLEGRRVYFDSPVAPFGSMAERTLIDPAAVSAVPDGVADDQAVALGIAGLAAWLALELRARVAPGESVLVLGASGTVGGIAIQAAKLLGAGRVVAAARREAGLERAAASGADATVRIGATDDLAGALREAAGGGFDVVVDPVWGEPAAAATEACNTGARLVQLGQAAGSHASLASAAVRGRQLAILGHSNFAVPVEIRRAAYARMCDHAAAGELAVVVERVALEDVGSAYERQAASPHAKLVIVP